MYIVYGLIICRRIITCKRDVRTVKNQDRVLTFTPRYKLARLAEFSALITREAAIIFSSSQLFIYASHTI